MLRFNWTGKFFCARYFFRNMRSKISAKNWFFNNRDASYSYMCMTIEEIKEIIKNEEACYLAGCGRAGRGSTPGDSLPPMGWGACTPGDPGPDTSDTASPVNMIIFLMNTYINQVLLYKFCYSSVDNLRKI